MYDFIGDIHGHADKLEELLQKLGYQKNGGETYRHPDKRQVFFLGDYIDRGPKIRETLQIVRSMVDGGSAVAIMGNHEYNALCYHFEDRGNGGHLRPHLIKNTLQHYETLRQFKNKQQEYDDYINWFFDLPLYMHNENFWAVHACWDWEVVSILHSMLYGRKLNEDLLEKSAIKKRRLHQFIDISLKGKEIPLPEGSFFLDKDKHKRTNIRVKWWESPENKTYPEISVHPSDQLPNKTIPKALQFSNPYPENEKPVFFGHYWLTGRPRLLKHNVCCLDFSVAKDGYLAAYRFDGEQVLSEEKLVWV